MNILDLANQRKQIPSLQQQLSSALMPLIGSKIDDALIYNIESKLREQQMGRLMRGINLDHVPLKNLKYDFNQQAIQLEFASSNVQVKFDYSLREMTLVSGQVSHQNDYGVQGFVMPHTYSGIYGDQGIYGESGIQGVPGVYLNGQTSQMDLGTVKGIVKNNLLIKTKSRSELIRFSGPEQKAVETLREIISESEFRKFIAHGFITVVATSGRKYQILRNQNHIKVWKAGKVVEEICIRIIDNNVPKTDKLIAFKTMIEANEDEFRKMGNVYKMCG